MDLVGDVLPYPVLRQGFTYDNDRVPLLAPQEIFKPRILELPLSITTAPDGPYDDTFGPDGLLQYRYRGTDPTHRDNVGLRELMQQRLPLVYLHGDTAHVFINQATVRQLAVLLGLNARRDCLRVLSSLDLSSEIDLIASRRSKRKRISLGFRGGRYDAARVARRRSRVKVVWDGFDSGLSAKCRVVQSSVAEEGKHVGGCKDGSNRVAVANRGSNQVCLLWGCLFSCRVAEPSRLKTGKTQWLSISREANAG